MRISVELAEASELDTASMMRSMHADAIKERAPVRPDAIIKEVFNSSDFYQAAEARRKVFTNAGKYNTDKNYASMISLLKDTRQS